MFPVRLFERVFAFRSSFARLAIHHTMFPTATYVVEHDEDARYHTREMIVGEGGNIYTDLESLAVP